jgi:HlyD family secretion protein
MQKIKDTKQKILSLIKKPKYYISGIVILLLLVIFSFGNNGNKTQEVIEVRRDNVIKTVSVSGKTKAASFSDLSFEKSGKVTYVFANVGDRVTTGQSLVRLDSGELNANLLQAEANLSAQQIKLTEMRKGTRVEELNLQYTRTDKANSDLANSKTSLINKIRDSYTVTDDSLRNKIYPIFVDPNKYNLSLKFGTDASLEEDICDNKNIIEDNLVLWSKNLRVLNDSSDIVSYYNYAKTNLNLIKKIADDSFLAVTTMNDASGLTDTEIESWKTNISTARSNINTAIDGLTSAINSYEANSYSYKIAKDELTVKESGYTLEQIQAQEASVESAAAQVASINAQLLKNVIFSPIDGIVTKQDAKVGEIVPANVVVVSVLSENNFEVEAYVPEINVGKISIGNDVKMKMDAFSGETFMGKISYIEPAETLIDNIPNFKLKISFNYNDSRFKNGLTVDADIEVDKKSGVIVVPRYAVTEKDGKYYVEKVEGRRNVEKNVSIGLQGDNGLTEIISGLGVGDKVMFSGNTQ